MQVYITEEYLQLKLTELYLAYEYSVKTRGERRTTPDP